MQTTIQAEQPFCRLFARNAAIAFGVATVVALVRHDRQGLFSIAVLALWPSLGGHYVELAFANYLSPRIPQGRLAQTIARLLTWFAGGTLLYACMAGTSRGLPIKHLPLRLWWFGGFLFIGLELVVHAILAIRGLPNIYGLGRKGH